MDRKFRLFGTRKQTEMLILVGLLEETYASELAKLLGVGLMSVQNYVKGMELSGVLATRVIGKERRIALNPRFFARKELKALLARLSDAEPELQKAAASLRRRPRRTGKPIDKNVPDDLKR